MGSSHKHLFLSFLLLPFPLCVLKMQGKVSFMIRIVRCWHGLPGVVLAALLLESTKVRLEDL